MGSDYTDAQKKASMKYQKTLSNISIKIKPEIYERYKKAAAAAGLSLREFVLLSMEEKIKRGPVLASGDDHKTE